jgi:hypothetical protein
MFTGATPTEVGTAAVNAVRVNVAEPKLAREGWGPLTTVGTSSMNSAVTAGPV